MAYQDTFNENPARSEIQEILEALIDRNSLAEIISALVEVANAKAAHIQEAWHDKPLARGWQSTANKLARVAAHCDV